MAELTAEVCESRSVACQLGRIAESMSGFDWDSFWATLLATVVGALVASFISIFVARAQRPQPFFRADAEPRAGDWWRPVNQLVAMPIVVANIGDGPAYDLRVRAVGGSRDGEEARTAKFEAGETVRSEILIDVVGVEQYDEYGDTVRDDRTYVWPDSAAVLVTWRQPRGRQRSVRLVLRDPGKQSE